MKTPKTGKAFASAVHKLKDTKSTSWFTAMEIVAYAAPLKIGHTQARNILKGMVDDGHLKARRFLGGSAVVRTCLLYSKDGDDASFEAKVDELIALEPPEVPEPVAIPKFRLESKIDRDGAVEATTLPDGRELEFISKAELTNQLTAHFRSIELLVDRSLEAVRELLASKVSPAVPAQQQNSQGV
ncbi:hypothetical protein [Hyphomicrobium sp.]|uniref:hypothetical protein n=1 Tax=Hyphomicrobium sp. TaxID=82 RepID=UPI001D681E8C|nr:hypothetical protein [Hyphomicrobium sp.]MBY0560143.1 hypothetical protein [Hyphomicrobium sp.]